jgi:hypothetical protein
VSEAVSLVVKWPERVDHHSRRRPRSRKLQLYLHSPIRLHGVMLN